MAQQGGSRASSPRTSNPGDDEPEEDKLPRWQRRILRTGFPGKHAPGGEFNPPEGSS